MKFSELYKLKRPENFSDSEVIREVSLPREVLAYELKTISTNQKQDEFETLSRRLAEKFIAPNLIPQVGPTGGGDGKTDSETYSVSKHISDRWFIPENGWKEGENWAFAISSKKDWKSKAKGDIKKIIETQRGYTRIYFITNQLVASKKKKDFQDKTKNDFDIDLIILDGEWILEKIYNNDLIDLVVDTLNLSNVYKKKDVKLGPNDSCRLKELEKLEDDIANPKKYFKYDFQLVEDALEAALLSRMLEKNKDEVYGKFDRAIRFCKEIDIPKLWIKIYYQRAWTSIYWYDDYSAFIESYKYLKKYISTDSNIADIERYFNLYNSLIALSSNKDCNLADYKVSIKKEEKDFINILNGIKKDKKRPNSALIVKSYIVFIDLTRCVKQGKNPDEHFKKLSQIIKKSVRFWDFPFESTKQIIEELGNTFPNSVEYDNLIDKVAEVSEKRNLELTSGKIFIRRAGQKLQAKYYKESIVYFGKAIMKLAKEETHYDMCLVFLGLGIAYRELGLIWASNNSFISACSISFKSISNDGIVSQSTYRSIEEIIKNELFIGRIPIFFTWHEMYYILKQRYAVIEENNDISFSLLNDGCLSTRLLLTDDNNKELQYLPDILGNLELCSSQDTVLYKLGYIDTLINKLESTEFLTVKSRSLCLLI
jgi:hypothetical protein